MCENSGATDSLVALFQIMNSEYCISCKTEQQNKF